MPPILYASIQEAYGNEKVTIPDKNRYFDVNKGIGWNYNAEWNNSLESQEDNNHMKNFDNINQNNNILKKYHTVEHFENGNEEKIESFNSIKCQDIIKHCQECQECRNKILESRQLTSVTSLSNNNNNNNNNYKDLMILLALGIFIILTLDKIKNKK